MYKMINSKKGSRRQYMWLPVDEEGLHITNIVVNFTLNPPTLTPIMLTRARYSEDMLTPARRYLKRGRQANTRAAQVLTTSLVAACNSTLEGEDLRFLRVSNLHIVTNPCMKIQHPMCSRREAAMPVAITPARAAALPLTVATAEQVVLVEARAAVVVG